MKPTLFFSWAVFTASAMGAGFGPGGGNQTGGNWTAGGQPTGGGGSFPSGAQFQNGGGIPNGAGNSGGGRASSGTSSPSHSSGVIRSGTVQSVPAVVSPPTNVSVPKMVAPAKPVVSQPVRPVPVQPAAIPVTKATGTGFIGKPGTIGTNNITTSVSPFHPPNPPDHRAITTLPSFTTTTGQTRIKTAATMGLGTMPAVRQHLLNHGQNLQTWSANRDLAFHQFHQQNAARFEDFQRNRNVLWNQLQSYGGDLVRMARERGVDWQNYRRDLWRFRADRANEIRDRVRNGCDDLFTFDWWCRQRGRNFLLGSHSPWWWWNPCSWNRASAFCGYGWGAAIYYDYGANVLVGDSVYVDGEDAGPGTAYAQQAMELANPPVPAEEPVPPQAEQEVSDWQTFGVFAVTQEKVAARSCFSNWP